ncbi:hypothetical protein NXW37_29610 [Bacteroides thetaiotaomicron]|nr:hypothetical protein [Bacteroides thetaiotaomicron]
MRIGSGGFPDFKPRHTGGMNNGNFLHMINLNHASKQPFFIMVRRGTQQNDRIPASLVLDGWAAWKTWMPNQKDALPQVIICVSWWMRTHKLHFRAGKYIAMDLKLLCRSAS